MRLRPKKGENRLFLIIGSIMIGWASFLILDTIISPKNVNFYPPLAFIFSMTGFVIAIISYIQFESYIPNTLSGLSIRMVPGLLMGIGLGFLQSYNTRFADPSILLFELIGLIMGVFTVIFSIETKDLTRIITTFIAKRKSAKKKKEPKVIENLP